MHARLIITEAGATVDVPYLVLADTSEHATGLAQRNMRSIIESAVKDSQPSLDCDEQEILNALQHGYWWADLGSEEFTVMIQEPEHVERIDKQKVAVRLQGGMVTDVEASSTIEVVVHDYDIDGADQSRLSRDADGRQCLTTVWRGEDTPCEDRRRESKNERCSESLNRSLEDGFVILTLNSANEPADGFEAWAYSGPLDFNAAAPVRFGLGSSPLEALRTLQEQITDMPDSPTA